MPDSDSLPQIEMPRYRCHKEVWALKIENVINSKDGTSMLIPADKWYAPLEVSAEYVNKHKPHANGYYVVYKGGYKSWSPADVFEDGYALIEPGTSTTAPVFGIGLLAKELKILAEKMRGAGESPAHARTLRDKADAYLDCAGRLEKLATTLK